MLKVFFIHTILPWMFGLQSQTTRLFRVPRFGEEIGQAVQAPFP